MYKASIDLGRINKYLKMKFSIVIKSDNFMPLISKFNISGNDYLKISPIPIITLEIKSNVDKHEEWNPNKSISLSRITKFIFCKRLSEIIESFKKEKDLFYYEGDTLKVNKDLATQIKEMVKVGTKICAFQPIVVEDEESGDLYEGVVLMINSADNYCYLTFEEMEYLVDYINTIDLDNLSLQMINTVTICNKMKSEHLQKPRKIDHEVIQNTQQEVSRLPIQSKSTIPEI